ncbi:MAG: HlyD family efflux transporter periplasmic adaptor subunit [Bacteroidia bacterium]
MNMDKYYQMLENKPFRAVGLIRDVRHARRFARICAIVFGVLFLLLFLPWTQNIRSYGSMTTYLPQDRPQTVQTIIAGRIEKWYVREGQLVQKGDTIVKITEIKEKFFDPRMLERYADQIRAKEGSQSSTADKVEALAKQVRSLQQEKILSIDKARNKVQQAKLKISSDSAEMKAMLVDLDIAKYQSRRADSLFKKGLISLVDLERRNLKVQESNAKVIAVENKLLTSRNELINANIELNSLEAEYTTKISKAESDLQSALSYLYETQGEIAKMNTEYANLSIRSGYYYVTAPQDGYVVQTRVSGVGENINEGDAICTIMPSGSTLAVQLYVRPMDIPLLEKGRKVRLQFDGWPALVFSGWPNYTFGTFGGVIAVIDNIDTKGHYRILVIPDPKDDPWPTQLRVGSGVYGWVMLKDVPVWYELWRQFNGFPPDYMGEMKDEDLHVYEKAKPEKKKKEDEK